MNGKFAKSIGPTRKTGIQALRQRRKEVLTALKVKRAQRRARGRVPRGTITALQQESSSLLAHIRDLRGYVPPPRARRPPPPRRSRS